MSRFILIAAFLLLQGADVILTWRLLETRPEVEEANPLANAVLARAGWPGVIALKFACTAVVLACVLAIAKSRPVFGQAFLGGICALMLCVVAWSASLLARPAEFDPAWLASPVSTHHRPMSLSRMNILSPS